jgi:two-component system chemotaxis response regulator CheB
MSKLRVLVVEDSITIRRRLIEVLDGDPDIEVVGEADNGKTAIALCQSLRPDVVTLDMVLPVMSGLAATEYIMAHFPTPILVVSASTNRGELFKTYEALAAGAVDVLEKPSADDPDGVWEQRFLATVKLVARIKVITHVRGKFRPLAPVVAASADGGDPRESSSVCELVAIGASTGGPAAIVEILRGLPSTFPLPILLVLHIGEAFAASLASWLDGLSPIRVRCATDGEALPPVGRGCMILAPADRHLVVRQGALWLNRDPERYSCRPSVDVLFESVAREVGPRAVACLLTGMGRDGATGLLAIRQAGGMTIAQDEATSVVYGMPQAAAQIGAAARLLPLPEIAPALRLIASRSGARRAP